MEEQFDRRGNGSSFEHVDEAFAVYFRVLWFRIDALDLCRVNELTINPKAEFAIFRQRAVDADAQFDRRFVTLHPVILDGERLVGRSGGGFAQRAGPKKA